MVLEHPEITRMRSWGYLNADSRTKVGECLLCKCDLHGEDAVYDADDFVETEDGLVCSDCWTDYFYWLKRQQGK